jgi:L-ascorbate metabolism protein UlaG (beta-lactamase superfamily)
VKFQGITMPHDREGGRRFGTNIAWRWTQGGIDILHLGGAAAPISTEEKILLSSPDILLLPVGGGAKAYNSQEAQQAIASLKPKVVIPTQYLTTAADPKDCDLESVDNFLNLLQGMEVKKLDSDSITIKPQDLPSDRTLIRVLSYPGT